MVRTIDKQTGEIRRIPVGGLYAPLPIPALRALEQANEFVAHRILVCLVSHLGDKGWLVYPSYDTIQREAKVSRGSIRPALDVLEDFGFIKVQTFQVSQIKKINKYYIQEASYKQDLMPKHVRRLLKKTARCLGCAKKVSRGEFSKGPNGGIHIGCGGEVISIADKATALD
jgi:hypothetical protein